MTDKDIKRIIKALKSNALRIHQVPKEIYYHKDIIATEKELGLRKSFRRGFDIIHNQFFVEELVYDSYYGSELSGKDERITFESFDEYYEYLSGDIYDNACYKFCDFSAYSEFINKTNIRMSDLKKADAFISETIDDATLELPSQEDTISYNIAEKRKPAIQDWCVKFNACTSGDDLKSVVKSYKTSELYDTLDISFFFYSYIFENENIDQRLAAIMQYMNDNPEALFSNINALCVIFNPNTVIENYNCSGVSMQTNKKHINRLKDFVNLLENGNIDFSKSCYFDTISHFYCEETKGYQRGKLWPIVSYKRYFESFDEFINYRKGNLCGVNLSDDLGLTTDLSSYVTDEYTTLPLRNADSEEYTVKKWYNEGFFYVQKIWKTEAGCRVKVHNFKTRYFFDFVFYLKGDLSNASLLFCDGLQNLPNTINLNLSGARLTSSLCERFGVAYEVFNLSENMIESFAEIEKNEKETALAFYESLNINVSVPNLQEYIQGIMYKPDTSQQRIHYITDLHLMHRLKNANCRSFGDVIYVIQNIIDKMIQSNPSLLLIGGDVSSDFHIFKIFIDKLRLTLDFHRKKTDVIFVLGNHELWPFPDKSLSEIVQLYDNAIKEKGMHLLHNELLYRNDDNSLNIIPYNKLKFLSISELRNTIGNARLIILGGLGFSGYNKVFNADNGIYRNTIDRNQEIYETKLFEDLYNLILPCISDKNVVIFTHTPKKDWCATAKPHKNFVYINGHTHRNEFYDDGDYRVYSDNQIGYQNNNPQLRSFLLDSDYDIFADYKDGIHVITGEQYNDFYRGKNIQICFTRNVYKLYMLKKNGYYCFIHQSKSGSLTILNGGALKKLDIKDINYYYQHMDEVATYIRNPLDKYMNIQKQISKEIIKIGGSGLIHGCIIDIDWYNHIYLNPVDLTITSYWAMNMVDKYVYTDVPSLLERECPTLYANYLKLLNDGSTLNSLIVKKQDIISVLPQAYHDTDIYKVSREIKKMQKLTTNILCAWYEPPPKTKIRDNKLDDRPKCIQK